jgi:hypothetical protein
MKKQINEVKRMQLIAGVITESEYRKSMNEAETPLDIEEFLDGMINDSIPEDSEEGEEVKGIWEADEYADEESYGEAAQEFIDAHKYIMGQGGKITVEGNPDVTYKALPNGDIAYHLIVTLDEAKKMDEAKKKKSSSSSGLITFDQLKQSVFQEYGFEDDEDVIESFKEVNNLGDLVMLLDDLGYNDEEAYEFIIKAILK